MKKLIFLVLISIFLSGCFKTPTQSKVEPEPKPSPKIVSPIDKLTQDWQEYKNQEYSYLIKYPPNWYLYPQVNSSSPIVLANQKTDQTKDNYANFTILIKETNGTNLTSYSEITESIDAGFINSNLEISGSPAVLLVGSYQNQFTASIYILHKDYFYRLAWQATDEQTYNQEKEIFKQILATFKFTD